MFKFFLIFFTYILAILNSTATESQIFGWDSKGNIVREEVIEFPSGKKFVSFRHEGGFETSISRYGSYMCDGNILFNKQENLENMSYACRFSDQKGDSFFSLGSRKKGTSKDRSSGKMIIVEGEGYWKEYEGKVCTYGLENVEKVIFVKSKCK